MVPDGAPLGKAVPADTVPGTLIDPPPVEDVVTPFEGSAPKLVNAPAAVDAPVPPFLMETVVCDHPAKPDRRTEIRTSLIPALVPVVCKKRPR